MEACKLLDNGWTIHLFRDGLGSYGALAVRQGESVARAMKAWRSEKRDHPLEGENRRCGCGMTPDEAIASLVEKLVFGRLPKRRGKLETVDE